MVTPVAEDRQCMGPTFDLAEEVDPRRSRTIGVFTKPDLKLPGVTAQGAIQDAMENITPHLSFIFAVRFVDPLVFICTSPMLLPADHNTCLPLGYYPLKANSLTFRGPQEY